MILMREQERSKKTVVLSLIIFILLWTLSAYGAPKIVVTPEEHRFGEINEGEKVIHKFVIENKGDSDLIINDVKPG